jgi:copper chaperone CopZ
VDRPFFKYRIFPSEDHPTEIRLFPKEESLQYEPFEEGDPPHTVVFDTGISYVGADAIEDEIEQISGVESVQISTSTGQIRVYEDQDPSHGSDLERLVNQIYETLSKLFAEFDRRIEDDELTRQESYQRAISSYWEAAREGTE